MNQPRADSTPTCDRCRKPLADLPCRACGGRGTYRRWLLFQRQCAVCAGRGRSLRCPDELRHIAEDLKLPPGRRADAVYRQFKRVPPAASSSLPRPGPPGRRAIPPRVPPPWDASYPNPWHPMHPRNPRNQPFSPLNPNSPTSPNNPLNPLNPNSPLHRKPFKK